MSLVTLVFLQTRINLSPFTKDFRGEEQLNESMDQFFVALPWGGAHNKSTRYLISTALSGVTGIEPETNQNISVL